MGRGREYTRPLPTEPTAYAVTPTPYTHRRNHNDTHTSTGGTMGSMGRNYPANRSTECHSVLLRHSGGLLKL